MKTGRFLTAVLFAVTMLMSGAWAQNQDYDNGPDGQAAPPNGQATKSDGPAPDVARISLIHGDVSMARGDTGEWSSTTVNAPLVQGDQVATGEGARAEVQLDFANILRLAARSQAKIADLTRTRIQVQVAQGYANYTVVKGNEADVEIDSPNVAVRPLRPGRYRMQVISDSETNVIVRDGEAEITTPQGSTRVQSGEMITVRGTDQPEYKVSSAPENDDWDRWNKDRDNVIRDAASWGHTNRYYTGANDLDSYGHWVYVPGYGNVWQPYQEATWAPYQAGRWVWEPYYGWTWVSYDRGVGPLITMAGGSITAAAGAGGLDRFTCIIVRCGRPRLSSLSALDTTPDSALAPLDGSPWARMTRFIPGTDAALIA